MKGFAAVLGVIVIAGCTSMAYGQEEAPTTEYRISDDQTRVEVWTRTETLLIDDFRARMNRHSADIAEYRAMESLPNDRVRRFAEAVQAASSARKGLRQTLRDMRSAKEAELERMRAVQLPE